MKYLLNNIEVDIYPYLPDIESGFKLRVCKQLIDLTGASLKEVSNLYERIITEQNIKVDSLALEIQATCRAELNEQ